MKFTAQNLKKLETLFQQLGYTLRYEKGNFQAGYCLVKEKHVIIINKFYTPETRQTVLLELLEQLHEQLPLDQLDEDYAAFLQQALKQSAKTKQDS